MEENFKGTALLEQEIKEMKVWKYRTGELSLETPKIMGILNVTPDSFFDGGRYDTLQAALDRAYEIGEEGAHILDIGGESTRPGSRSIGIQEEIDRVLPVIEGLGKDYPLPISIDTQKPEVAEEALKRGAHIINDVGGFQNPQMVEVALRFHGGICIMHMKGTPQNMQNSPYYDNVVEEVSSFLVGQAQMCENRGIERDHIVLDPGIGFGKRLEDNLDLFRAIPSLSELGYPLLIGASRKSFIKMIAGGKTNRLGGSVAIHFYSVLKGASLVRVHDVQETREALLLLEALQEENSVSPF